MGLLSGSTREASETVVAVAEVAVAEVAEAEVADEELIADKTD